MHPEDGGADHEVADGAAADAGDDGEKGEGDQGLLLLRRQQRARDGENGDADIIEQHQRVGREDGRGHGFPSHPGARRVKGGT